MQVTILGIRHHGPGSARCVLQALKNLEPDCILLEAPSDAQALLQHVLHKKLKPPVAMLVYNPQDLRQAAFLPLAEFSPEWQAMRWALKRECPLRFFDLPMSQSFVLEGARQTRIQLNTPTEDWMRDPLSTAARLAGFSDVERWWEHSFEQHDGETAYQDLLLELMITLRTDRDAYETDLNLLREAYMRQEIRAAVAEGFERIAVICGAWHGPALYNWEDVKESADKKALRGLKKVKTQTAWIPWSFESLSAASGYGAGVLAPAWYQLLFKHHHEAVSHWMVRAARLLRELKFDASPAQATEAVVLAETLAALRKLPVPGQAELRDAALGILCEGNEQRLKRIEDRLIFGEEFGKVPPELPKIPLQQDIEKAIRAARLRKEYESTATVQKSLDLRKPANLQASILLHRLLIIGIAWGKKRRETGRELGSFSEHWRLKWKPTFALRLLEASVWGNTLSEAATQNLRETASKQEGLSELATHLQAALDADLPEAIAPLVEALRQAAALDRDIRHLMKALPTLIRVLRYGDLRQTALPVLQQVVEELVPRVCIGLPNAAMRLDEEMAQELQTLLLEAHHALHTLHQKELLARWSQSLEQLANTQAAHALLQGTATRLRFDEQPDASLLRTQTRMAFALSDRNNPDAALHWLRGFLHGSGLLLLHHPQLWQLVDQWVHHMPMQRIQELLPLLRKVFSRFSPSERTHLLQLAENPQASDPVEQRGYDPERRALIEPVIEKLLRDAYQHR